MTENEEEIDDMIAFYKGDYLSEVNNQVESFIQAFEEKTEILICMKCMGTGIFYCDGEGTIACKHNWPGLLEQYKNIQK